MTDMQLLVDLALDIEGVTPARAEITLFDQQLDDLTGAIAYTLGVLAGIVTSVAADHTTCRLPHCRTCRELRWGLAAITALNARFQLWEGQP